MQPWAVELQSGAEAEPPQPRVALCWKSDYEQISGRDFARSSAPVRVETALCCFIEPTRRRSANLNFRSTILCAVLWWGVELDGASPSEA